MAVFGFAAEIVTNQSIWYDEYRRPLRGAPAADL